MKGAVRDLKVRTGALPNPAQCCVSATSVQRHRTKERMSNTHLAAPQTPTNAIPIALNRWPSVTSFGRSVPATIVEFVAITPTSTPPVLGDVPEDPGKSDVGWAIRTTPNRDSKPASKGFANEDPASKAGRGRREKRNDCSFSNGKIS